MCEGTSVPVDEFSELFMIDRNKLMEISTSLDIHPLLFGLDNKVKLCSTESVDRWIKMNSGYIFDFSYFLNSGYNFHCILMNFRTFAVRNRGGVTRHLLQFWV